jgi:catechol 2,3-dioxygenase-like lactoylglutathione lyase family enzyme
VHEPNFDIHPAHARWTHVALRVDDIDATIAFYTEMTPLELIDRRQDDAGFGAWLGMPEATNNPFILVVAQFLPGCDPYADAPKEVLAPFAHLGIELPTRQAVDDIAARADADGRLAMPATMMPAPIGYICMVSDPDGNMIEFSWDQGVYATLRDRFGDPPRHGVPGQDS